MTGGASDERGASQSAGVVPEIIYDKDFISIYIPESSDKYIISTFVRIRPES
jgi:hypothetical protein